jgi:hypothetical protein
LLVLSAVEGLPLFRPLLSKLASLDGAQQLRHHRLVEKQCAQCGAAMSCQQDAGCWCAELPHVPMPAGDEGCLCRNCLLAKIEALKNSAKTKEA